MKIEIEQATANEFDAVSGILTEAAAWAERRHGVLWVEAELEPSRLAREVEAGAYYLARCGAEFAGTVRYQNDDPLFWPDAAPHEAAYVHRLAVRRRFAGGEVSAALLRWACGRARADGRRYLRLDTDMSRPKLRRLYEEFGFVAHSERRVGAYLVMRYQLRLGPDIAVEG